MILQLSRQLKWIIHNSKNGKNIHVHWLKMYWYIKLLTLLSSDSMFSRMMQLFVLHLKTGVKLYRTPHSGIAYLSVSLLFWVSLDSSVCLSVWSLSKCTYCYSPVYLSQQPVKQCIQYFVFTSTYLLSYYTPANKVFGGI